MVYLNFKLQIMRELKGFLFLSTLVEGILNKYQLMNEN